MKKKKTILGSDKSYRNSQWLGPQDKVDELGPILGAEPKKSKILSTKFMGCSRINMTNKKVLAEIYDDPSDFMYLMWEELRGKKPRKLTMNDIVNAATEIANTFAEGGNIGSKKEDLISSFLHRPDGFMRKMKKRDLVQESLTYNEFANADKTVDKKCPVCGITFKNIHSTDQKFCCAECELKGTMSNNLEEAWDRSQIKKAGFIPYYRDNNGVARMLFVISSDPSYGGDKPMIAKGHVDAGENEMQAGLREANEECGLRPSNLISNTVKIGWKGEITGYTETSEMTIFIGEVTDPVDFDKPGFEVSETKWLTADEFYRIGRKSQSNIVKACDGKI